MRKELDCGKPGDLLCTKKSEVAGSEERQYWKVEKVGKNNTGRGNENLRNSYCEVVSGTQAKFQKMYLYEI